MSFIERANRAVALFQYNDSRQQRRARERAAKKEAPRPPKRPGRYARWRLKHKITGKEIADAIDLLMTGPRAQTPTYRAIRKMIFRLRRGDRPGAFGWSPWRSAPTCRRRDK